MHPQKHVVLDKQYHYRYVGKMYLAETDDQAVDSDTECLINAASLLEKCNGCLASKSHYLLDREMVIEKHDD